MRLYSFDQFAAVRRYGPALAFNPNAADVHLT